MPKIVFLIKKCYNFQVKNSSQVLSSIGWEKMAEAVRTKQAFLGAGAYIVTPERVRTVNFTIPVSVEPYTFLIARPRELSRALLFLSPFTTNVKIKCQNSQFYMYRCVSDLAVHFDGYQYNGALA